MFIYFVGSFILSLSLSHLLLLQSILQFVLGIDFSLGLNTIQLFQDRQDSFHLISMMMFHWNLFREDIYRVHVIVLPKWILACWESIFNFCLLLNLNFIYEQTSFSCFSCCRILFYSTFEVLFLLHHINGGGKSLMLLMLHKTFGFGFPPPPPLTILVFLSF